MLTAGIGIDVNSTDFWIHAWILCSGFYGYQVPGRMPAAQEGGELPAAPCGSESGT